MKKLLVVLLAGSAVFLTGCPRRPRIPRPPGVPMPPGVPRPPGFSLPGAETVLITDLAPGAASAQAR